MALEDHRGTSHEASNPQLKADLNRQLGLRFPTGRRFGVLGAASSCALQKKMQMIPNDLQSFRICSVVPLSPAT
jgi:hypothetical protein